MFSLSICGNVFNVEADFFTFNGNFFQTNPVETRSIMFVMKGNHGSVITLNIFLYSVTWFVLSHGVFPKFLFYTFPKPFYRTHINLYSS